MPCRKLHEYSRRVRDGEYCVAHAWISLYRVIAAELTLYLVAYGKLDVMASDHAAMFVPNMAGSATGQTSQLPEVTGQFPTRWNRVILSEFSASRDILTIRKRAMIHQMG